MRLPIISNNEFKYYHSDTIGSSWILSVSQLKRWWIQSLLLSGVYFMAKLCDTLQYLNTLVVGKQSIYCTGLTNNAMVGISPNWNNQAGISKVLLKQPHIVWGSILSPWVAHSQKHIYYNRKDFLCHKIKIWHQGSKVWVLNSKSVYHNVLSFKPWHFIPTTLHMYKYQAISMHYIAAINHFLSPTKMLLENVKKAEGQVK